MDNKRIRKIIVREGSVILFIFLLILVVKLLPNQVVIRDKKNTEEFAVIYDITIGSNFMFERIFTFMWDKDHEKADRRSVKAMLNDPNFIKESISLAPLKSNALFLLLLYPLYLVIRFIPWVIKVFREK